ncbi:MAG: hypothetical protein WAP03_10220 [Methylorubrum rhodinum]|uniref:hypothetical protein n=1 Tax=Methylorubrum rhodinum TaxID=29428 RepID=UPI003BB13C34
MIDPTQIPDHIRKQQEEEMLEYLNLGKYQALREKEAMAYIRPNVRNPEDRTWLKSNRDQVPHHYEGKSRIYHGIYIAHFKLYGDKAWLLHGGIPPVEAESAQKGEANTTSGNTGSASSGFPNDQAARPGIAPGTTKGPSKPAALASALRTLR